MAVGADQGVREGDRVLGEDHPGQMLQIDLVTDPGARRYDAQVAQSALSPPQELVPLPVALVLQLDVTVERLPGTEAVGDHRVIDHQLDGPPGVYQRRITAEEGHGLPHRDQIHQAGHAGEVLHQHPRGGELDLGGRFTPRVPVGDGGDLIAGDGASVLIAQEVLQQHFEAVRQSPSTGQGVQPVERVARTEDIERPEGGETVQ